MSVNIILFAAVFMVGCKSSEKTPETAKTAPKVEEKSSDAPLQEPSNCYEVAMDSESFDKIQSKTIKILKSQIIGNEFHVTCEFSGCPSDELYFAWNGAMKKSYPGQVTIALGYSQSGMCESIITQDYCFQIGSLAINDKIYLKVNDGEMLLYEINNK
ncbi:MAG: hypothetical protein ACPGEG_02235 [Salibacteraceae bacterium]